MNTPTILHRAALTALTFLFGWQAFRSLLPLQAFLLRDRLRWNVVELLLFSVLLFLLAFLASWLRRRWGARRMLVITAGGVAFLRLALQIWTSEPLVELVLATAAVAVFFLFLPARLMDARDAGDEGTSAFALGLASGLTLDTAIHGAYTTWDVSWRSDLGSLILVLALVALHIVLLRREARSERSTVDGGSSPWPWLAFGPFLFLQALIFQNIARLTALTSWPPAAVFGWTLASQVLGCGFVAFLLSRPAVSSRPLAVVAGIVLVATQTDWVGGWVDALHLMAGHLLSLFVLVLVLRQLHDPTRRVSPPYSPQGDSSVSPPYSPQGDHALARSHGLSLSHSLSMFAFMVLTSLYYLAYNIYLPFDTGILPPIAAGIHALAGIVASGRRTADATAVLGPAFGRRIVAAGALLLVLPIIQAWTTDSPRSVERDGPIRVMSYNVHCGFDPAGHLGMEAIARAIEAQDADVVALQEISRGWYINGSLDMLAWLSERLGMAYVFAPSADLLWGNAVLSRLPITASELRPLPSEGLPIRRGFAAVDVDAGGRSLRLIATHFHHRGNGSDVRLEQARAVVDYWRGRPLTVLAGDLNAQPQHPEMRLLADAGWRDVHVLAGRGDGATFPAVGPKRRIDYIWVSPDLEARDAVVVPDPASDHLGVAVTLVPEGG